MTPQRWQRSLQVRPAELPSMTINGPQNPVGRTLQQLEAIWLRDVAVTVRKWVGKKMTDEELSLALIPTAVEMMQELGWVTADQFDYVVQELRDEHRAKLQRLKLGG